MGQIRLTIENREKEIMLVFIEPEALDYWLEEGEELQLVADKYKSNAQFNLWHTKEGITVFPERADYITTYQGGKELEVGHKRPSDWS